MPTVADAAVQCDFLLDMSVDASVQCSLNSPVIESSHPPSTPIICGGVSCSESKLSDVPSAMDASADTYYASQESSSS